MVNELMKHEAVTNEWPPPSWDGDDVACERGSGVGRGVALCLMTWRAGEREGRGAVWLCAWWCGMRRRERERESGGREALV